MVMRPTDEEISEIIKKYVNEALESGKASELRMYMQWAAKEARDKACEWSYPEKDGQPESFGDYIIIPEKEKPVCAFGIDMNNGIGFKDDHGRIYEYQDVICYKRFQPPKSE